MNGHKSVLVLAAIAALGAAGLVGAPSTDAGNLEPPAEAVYQGTPVPTMKTVEDAEPRTPISSLPFEITESGSYYLTGNLSSTSHGIIVSVDDVTIDLNGFVIAGPGNLNTTGIDISGRKNVLIRNGTVREFDGGVSGGNNDEGNRAIEVRSLHNRSHGFRFDTFGLVKNCVSAWNNLGIVFDTRCVATGNIVYGNTSIGIHMSHGKSIITENIVSNNPTNVTGCSDCVFANNSYE